MKVTLDIKENKAAAFLNFVKSLDFIQIKTEEDEPSNEEIMASIERGMKEAQLHKKGKLKLQTAQEFLNEL
ncbi:MAG: hypothetical protein RIF46_04960 [Cyclobacteriaceae bacterium]